MTGTNRDVAAMREALEYEIFRLQALKKLPGRSADVPFIERQIAYLNRERVALCAAIVARRIEASKDVVEFSRWVNGNGALNNISFRGATRAANSAAVFARQQP